MPKADPLDQLEQEGSGGDARGCPRRLWLGAP